jgi:homogentisate 1,2-dioxygenase
MKSQALSGASRNYFQFMFPHSHSGTNNAYNNIPSKQLKSKLLALKENPEQFVQDLHLQTTTNFNDATRKKMIEDVYKVNQRIDEMIKNIDLDSSIRLSKSNEMR